MKIDMKFYWRTLSSFLFALLLGIGLASGQSQEDLDLAKAYFQNGEMDKAVTLYDKIFNKAPENTAIYGPYLACLKNLKLNDKAEKLIKKEIKLFPLEPGFKFDLLRLYKETGQAKKEETVLKEIIKSVNMPDHLLIEKTAKAFIENRMWEDAIAVYKKGNNLFNDEERYNYQIASIYGQQAKWDELYTLLIQVLGRDESRIQEVKNTIQTYLVESKTSNVLKEKLYAEIQKRPSYIPYMDLLLWVYVQDQDFKNAVKYSIQFDKRLGQNGMIVLNIGDQAMQEKFFNEAISAYSYVIGLGKNQDYFYQAQMSLFDAQKQKLLSGRYTTNELNSLRNLYLSTIQDYEKERRIYELIDINIDLAELYGEYLMKTDSAISILEKVINTMPVESNQLLNCKVKLGDYYLIGDSPWEATLLYSQVDKAAPGAEIGELAKFKNAKWSYYQEDFVWSQSQMDILKSSTSELIANDALNLTVFISENLGSGADSLGNINSMKMYAKADLLSFQHQYAKALATYDSILVYYPNAPLADDILYAKANIWIKEQNFEKAIEALSEIGVKYGEDIYGDDALYTKASLYDFTLNDQKKAMELYSDLFMKYPGSTYVVKAKKRYRQLRGDKIEEIKND